MAIVIVDWEEGSARWLIEDETKIDFILAGLVSELGEPDTIT